MNIQSRQSPYYENIEFNLSTGEVDYDLDANQATFLTKFGAGNVIDRFPSWVSIRTNQTISVKLNETSSHAITIASTDSPFVISGVEIKNMFLTNSSGQTAAVKLLFTDNPN